MTKRKHCFIVCFCFSRIACEGSSTLLDYGVTVAQQILVLLVPVRIRVVQQFLDVA